MSDIITPPFGRSPNSQPNNIRREVVPFIFEGRTLWRANLWRDGLHSSKTFLTAAEAHAWTPPTKHQG